MSANQKVGMESEGHVVAKVGRSFANELHEIKIARIAKGKSLGFISTEKITNMIIRHVKNWNEIKEDLINVEEREIEKFTSWK